MSGAALIERQTQFVDADEKWMLRAIELARVGLERGEMPIAAIVVVDGQVVGEAHTQERTQGRLLVHADLLALDAADRRLRGRRQRATPFVTLDPCLMCLGAVFTARIGAVVYALESPSDGAVETFRAWDAGRKQASMPGYNLPEIRRGVLRQEAASLFREHGSRSPAGWAKAWAEELAELGDR